MSRNPFTRLKNGFNSLKERATGTPLNMVMTVLGAVIGFFLLALICAIVSGVLIGDYEDVSSIVAIVRDLFIILLAVQGMIVTLALVVMIVQLAALLNLLQNEVNPIVKNLQDTTSTIKGTAEFLSENVTAPVIETTAWLSGIRAFTKEITGITKHFRPKKDKTQDEPVAE